MPATFTAPTDRQVSFYNTLAAERGLPTIESFAPGISRREASAAIDTLMAQPRTAPASQPSQSDGEAFAAPHEAHRAGRMLANGGIEATATLADGRHVTVTIRTRKRSGRGWANGFPGEEGSRTNVKILGQRVGWITVDANGVWHLTLRTRNEAFVAAVHGVLNYCARLPLGSVKRVQEASRCGRCFRTLTDPVSIDRGIGPECLGMQTGSRHVPSDEAVAEQRERRAARHVHRDADGDVGCGGCDNGEHCGACACCPDEAHTAESWTAEQVEARMHAQVAEAELAAERNAYETEMRIERAEMRESLTAMADALMTPSPVAPSDTLTADIRRARDTIIEALDAYCDGCADARHAIHVFDQLAGR